MKNNKWEFIGYLGQVKDIDSNRVVFKTNSIKDKSVVRHVVHMHNVEKSLKQIDAYLLDADCTTEDRELIVESIYKHFQIEYEFRAVVSDPEGDGVQGIPLVYVNVEEHHDVIAIGLYKNLNDGTQEHILDLDGDTIKKFNKLFMGFKFKG